MPEGALFAMSPGKTKKEPSAISLKIAKHKIQMKKLLVLLPVLAVFSILILIFIPTTNVLTITNRKNNSEQVISREAYKKGFIISYTHSVNKGRVHDYYKVLQDRQLQLYQTEFVSYGAGMPEPYETPGAVFESTDTGYFIKNLNRTLPKFLMAVGVIADHTILIGQNMADGQEVMLKNLFAPQTSLIFQVEKISLIKLLLSEKI